MDQNGVNNIRKLYEIMTKLEQKVATHESEEIKLVAMGNIDIEYVRKCTECIFRKTNKICGIVMPRDKMSKAQGAKTNKICGIVMPRDKMSKAQGAKPQLEKVIIKSGGRQYADILKTVKSSVNIDKAGWKR
ncbi:hypothetical protein QE152_g3732 [Popillia japonica]|uniref:Uncharacterized protein n=1 Tax=Popillia japonica TaxID=7064 RepID=A0AAW1MZI3_POPJA